MIHWHNIFKATVFVAGWLFLLVWLYDIIFNNGDKARRFYRKHGFWKDNNGPRNRQS
jgi:hypothetical protein